MYGDKIKDFLNLILSNNFKDGIGHVSTYDLTFDYKKMIINKITLGPRKIQSVVDCGNGTTCYFNPEILKDLGVSVVPLYCEPDASFPNHIPDPAVESNMVALQEKVKEVGASVGIAFDGDGDRIGIVDEKGNLINGDFILMLCAKYLKDLGKLKNDTLVVTVMSNLGLDIASKKENIKTIKTKVGDRYVLEEMVKDGYVLGGEQSGHIIFLDYNTTGDGLVTALQVAAIKKEVERT